MIVILKRGGFRMFEKEFINFIAENMCESDFLSEKVY